MKPALHRSLVFWCGLVVMGFIVWGWRDSREHHSGVVYQEWSLSNSPDGLRLFHNPVKSGRVWEATREPVSALFHEIPRQWLPAPFFIRGGNESGPADNSTPKPTLGEWYAAWMRSQPLQAFMAYLPHWLILVAVLVPWLVLLGWRIRRRRGRRMA